MQNKQELYVFFVDLLNCFWCIVVKPNMEFYLAESGSMVVALGGVSKGRRQ